MYISIFKGSQPKELNNLNTVIKRAQTLGRTNPLLEPESQPLNPLPINHKTHEIMGVCV